MERDLTQLDLVEEYLKETGAVYIRDDEEPYPLFDRHQIRVYKRGIRLWDITCQTNSYGGDKGLLEVSGMLVRNGREAEGWLTAEEVIHRIKELENGK